MGQGSRNDINEIYEYLKEGMSSSEIRDINPGMHAKYWKWIERTENDFKRKECNKFVGVTVDVMYGKAGTGKTSYVMQKHGSENVYKLEKGNGDNLWFDGYNGQKVLIIDDFYGWIKYSKMLNLLDGYKMMLEVKGGVTYSNWEHVYVTSNDAPDKWYKQGLTPALNRRIDNVWNVKAAGMRYKENKMWKLSKVTTKVVDKWQDVEEEGGSVTLQVCSVPSQAPPAASCENTEVACNTKATGVNYFVEKMKVLAMKSGLKCNGMIIGSEDVSYELTEDRWIDVYVNDVWIASEMLAG